MTIYTNNIFVKKSIDKTPNNNISYLNSIFEPYHFDVIDQWKNKSSHVVIYGPNDIVPPGITAFQVTIKGDTYMTDKGGRTLSFVDGHGGSVNETWDYVEITLNTSSGGDLSSSTDITKEKIILHEIGHALKLAHPKQVSNLAPVIDGRGGYLGDACVIALMNQGSPSNPSYSTLACFCPKWHDIINLRNKWGY